MATGLTPPVKRPPRVISFLIATVFLLVFIVPWLVGYYTDWLWFGEVQFRGVFTTVLVTRMLLFLAFGAVAAAISWFAGYLVIRNRPEHLFGLDPEHPIVAFRASAEAGLRKALLFLPLTIGVLAGLVGQSNWRTVQMFLHGGDFGQQDPQFHMDYGFYAFTLPFLRLLTNSFSALLVVAFFIALIGHYVFGSIRVGNQALGQRGHVSNAARIQLTVTAGLWMLVKLASYWLDRFDLLNVRNDIFTGAGFTAIHAVLPAKIILMVIALVVALAFFSAVVLKDLRIPALATGLMVLSALVLGNGWPLMVEEFSVKPNRASKEAEFISRNIQATRFAYGITNDKVNYVKNWGANKDAKEERDQVANDAATLSNIRLLDPEILSATFTQQQQLKNFYGFPKTLTVDRYTVDGELRDYVVAARELDPQSLSENQKNWINRHTVYTHGNGIVAAPANQVDEVARDVGSTRGGYPVYTVSDLQAQSDKERAEKLGIKVDQPRVYYGPVISNVGPLEDYAIVGAAGSAPVEYDTDGSNFTYDGSGGVDISGMFNRIAFALRYQEINMVLSDRIGDDSKILYQRDPRARVEKVAPWLETDNTTYPAVIDGRIKWIVDGYTTLDSLPYASRTNLNQAIVDAQTVNGQLQNPVVNEEVGYIRNSVKAVVDAYDGTVELYEFDTEDPVLKAWRGVFPDTVKPKSEITDDLMEHLRYPEDMFKVQREMISRYHVDDAGVFFTNDAFWSVPGDPNSKEKTDDERTPNQPPYYVVAADPETGKPSFQLITPFRGLKREFLAAHMSASSDPDTYGRLTVRVLPTETQTQGPKQAQDTMMSSDQIARDRSLWQDTNDIKNGNLLTLPVGDGQILYVEPIYSQRKGQTSAFPKLLRVLVSYDGKVGYAPTIAEALSQVGIDPKEASDLAESEVEAGETKDPESGDTAADDKQQDKSKDSSTTSQDQASRVEAINKALQKVEQARNGSFEEFGKALDELDKAIKDYQDHQ
ncbi:UPF0182 family protein [Corynebacterium canis]|uniref:UPF0182 protein FRX94_03860 n=1 Tax=Corynebacterium canis TaxID=679663 RepID=A0A5C5UL60_9CORY|nr:UPF0182 family protein [Corynebacterium canis]TWT26748.1 UPF0182 family protein [Corynebacterium canis]WJY74548.1 hypothetical protein CCANI_03455 [Corynebacterium canis]